jgi:hypothetical protein
MKKQIKVWETTETVTILSAGTEGTYRVIWHRSDGGADEEFHVTPSEGEAVEDAVQKDLRARLGP